MAEKKNALSERLQEKDYKNRLIGIRTASDTGNLNSIIFTTKTLSTAFARHDFIRIDYGEEIAGRIEIQTRDYLIALSGERLEPVFEQIVLNRIHTIAETSKEINESQSAVRKIVIAALNTEEENE